MVLAPYNAEQPVVTTLVAASERLVNGMEPLDWSNVPAVFLAFAAEEVQALAYTDAYGEQHARRTINEAQYLLSNFGKTAAIDRLCQMFNLAWYPVFRSHTDAGYTGNRKGALTVNVYTLDGSVPATADTEYWKQAFENYLPYIYDVVVNVLAVGSFNPKFYGRSRSIYRAVAT